MNKEICTNLGKKGVKDFVSELHNQVFDIFLGYCLNIFYIEPFDEFISYFLPHFLPFHVVDAKLVFTGLQNLV